MNCIHSHIHMSFSTVDFNVVDCSAFLQRGCFHMCRDVKAENIIPIKERAGGRVWRVDSVRVEATILSCAHYSCSSEMQLLHAQGCESRKHRPGGWKGGWQGVSGRLWRGAGGCGRRRPADRVHHYRHLRLHGARTIQGAGHASFRPVWPGRNPSVCFVRWVSLSRKSSLAM